MLVLSRRPEEKVLLPTVPAVIKVISSQTGLVRLGIEAPSHVPILREELSRTARGTSFPATAPGDLLSPDLRHSIRNRVYNLTLGLTLLRIQLSDCDPIARRTLDGLEEELRLLRGQIAGDLGRDDGATNAALAAPTAS